MADVINFEDARKRVKRTPGPLADEVVLTPEEKGALRAAAKLLHGEISDLLKNRNIQADKEQGPRLHATRTALVTALVKLGGYSD